MGRCSLGKELEHSFHLNKRKVKMSEDRNIKIADTLQLYLSVKQERTWLQEKKKDSVDLTEEPPS